LEVKKQGKSVRQSKEEAKEGVFASFSGKNTHAILTKKGRETYVDGYANNEGHISSMERSE
jgi:myo-inositol-hexaphosphate 3-phosphohydrolase